MFDFIPKYAVNPVNWLILWTIAMFWIAIFYGVSAFAKSGGSQPANSPPTA